MLNLDTHIFVFALAGTLTNAERRLLAVNPWSISAIVLWELAMLRRMRRIEIDLNTAEFARALAPIHIWPLTLAVGRTVNQLDFKSDPADEIIAATSIVNHVPLITRDGKLLKSKITPLAR